MSVSGKKDSSFENPSNGRKRRLSSRSRSSNLSFTSPLQSSRSNSSKNSRGKSYKRKRLSSDSSSHSSSSPTSNCSISLITNSTSAVPPFSRLDTHPSSSGNSSVANSVETAMAQIPSNNRTNDTFGNNKFRKPGGSTNNHKKPGMGKKLSIKSRNGNVVFYYLFC